MKGQAIVSLVIFLVIVVTAIGVIFVWNYNDIIKVDKIVDESKANIESVLQRRLDLIPNLVETVKGYAAHEKETLTAVTQARINAKKALETISAKSTISKEDMAVLATSQRQLENTVKGLFALVENYPNLRASSNFLALQDQLEGTENRINVARQRYNHAVKNYNSKITMFPGIIIAPMMGFDEKESFEAVEKAQEPVKVNF